MRKLFISVTLLMFISSILAISGTVRSDDFVSVTTNFLSVTVALKPEMAEPKITWKKNNDDTSYAVHVYKIYQIDSKENFESPLPPELPLKGWNISQISLSNNDKTAEFHLTLVTQLYTIRMNFILEDDLNYFKVESQILGFESSRWNTNAKYLAWVDMIHTYSKNEEIPSSPTISDNSILFGQAAIVGGQHAIGMNNEAIPITLRYWKDENHEGHENIVKIFDRWNGDLTYREFYGIREPDATIAGTEKVSNSFLLSLIISLVYILF